MANARLVEYIQTNLRSGYQLAAIRSYLIQSGYPQSEVDEAIGAVYQQPVQQVVHHVSKALVISIVIIGLVLAIAIPTFLMSTSSDSSALGLKTKAESSSVSQGGTLEFNILLSGASSGSVTLTHEIIGTSVSQSETMSLSSSTTKQSFLTLPSSLTPGKYTVKTTALFEGTKSFSTFVITVTSADSQSDQGVPEGCIEVWSCEAWQPSQCPSSGKQTRLCTDKNSCGTIDNKPTTSQSCTPVVTTQPTLPVTTASNQGSTQTVWDTLNEVKSIASTDPSLAASKCPGLEIETHRDECYYDVVEVSGQQGYCPSIVGERTLDRCYTAAAKVQNDPSLCESVVLDSRKDSCYMYFVNNGNYVVCDKLTNQNLIDVCVALRDLPENS